VKNTFADLESNVVPVNCVDGGRWEDHFERFFEEDEGNCFE